jgi:hypothetical protein
MIFQVFFKKLPQNLEAVQKPILALAMQEYSKELDRLFTAGVRTPDFGCKDDTGNWGNRVV